MIYILYTILTVSVAGLCYLTYYLTRKHYYRPSQPLPAQTSAAPISVPTESTTELETAQDGINKIVDALDAGNKQRNKPVKPTSWMGMN